MPAGKTSARALVAPQDEGDYAASRVGYLLYRAERRLRRRLDDAVRAVGLSTTEYVALSVLRAHDGMSGAELARWTFVTPQAMNLVVGALERRGLIRRSPDPRHRRVLQSTVTPLGLQALASCDEAMDGIEADMLRELGEDAREELSRSLLACARALERTQLLRTVGPGRPRAVES
jgi:DNA-binding MarR family transcriptional regulator